MNCKAVSRYFLLWDSNTVEVNTLWTQKHFNEQRGCSIIHSSIHPSTFFNNMRTVIKMNWCLSWFLLSLIPKASALEAYLSGNLDLCFLKHMHLFHQVAGEVADNSHLVHIPVTVDLPHSGESLLQRYTRGTNRKQNRPWQFIEPEANYTGLAPVQPQYS